MSKRKSDELDDGAAENVQVIYQRTISQQPESLSASSSDHPHRTRKEGTGNTNEHKNELAIGSSIRPANRKTVYGTVGPFVKIKDTQELCFLTARRIFGPYQRPETFKGTAVYLAGSGETNDERQCGEAVVDDFSENMDVVLVKVTEECKPQKTKFIKVEKGMKISLGFQAQYFSLYGNTYSLMDARGLTSEFIEKNYRVIKVGMGTGLTEGIFHYTDGVVKTDSFFVVKKSPDGTLTEYITYTNQLLVNPVGDDKFADEEDVGAAVYLVDRCNLFHCIGVVLCLRDNGVLVTPLQDILNCLGDKIGQTLELVTFESQLRQMDAEIFDQKEIEIFYRALQNGKEKDKHIRINIIGFYAQGKTSLTKRLLHEPLHDVETTDGIDVHIKRCKIKGSCWKMFDPDKQLQDFSRRLVSVSKDLEHENTQTAQHDGRTGFQNKGDSGDQQIRNDIMPQTDHSEQTKTGPKTLYFTTDNSNSASVFEPHKKSREFLKNFIEELNMDQSSTEDEFTATIWDFGGQYIYYTTHQIFHSSDAIYLLVFNLNKDLDNVIEDYDFPERQEKMKNSLMFWVNSINAYVGTDDSTKPIVILVGTHRDTFKGNIEAKFNAVKDLFAGTEVRKHIFEQAFAVENSNIDDTVTEDLRQTIYKVGVKNAEERTVPASWLHLEVSLLEEKQKHIMSFKEVLHLSSNLQIENAEELKVFLKYHHNKGTLVYFDEEELDEYVVLNPQYIVDAFRCIITSKTMCDGSPLLHSLWKRMTSMAILEKKLLDAVWGKKLIFADFSKILLKFLIRHRILAEILDIEGNGSEISFKGTQNYIIPSFLKVICSKETTEDFLEGKKWSKVILGISLKKKIIIGTVYERLLAATLCNSSPVQFRDQNLVFQNMAYVKLNHRHAGRIQKVDGLGIELMVIRLCESDEDPNVICDDFRRKVEKVLRQEFKKQQKDLKHDAFSHYIKCNNTFHRGHGSKQYYSLEEIKNETSVCCPDNESHDGLSVPLVVDEWFQQVRKTSENIEHDDLIVTDGDLVQIAQALGKNWELLASELGITVDSLDRIKMDHRDKGIETVILLALNKWKSTIAKKPLLSDLLESIRRIPSLSVNMETIKTLEKKVLKRK